MDLPGALNGISQARQHVTEGEWAAAVAYYETSLQQLARQVAELCAPRYDAVATMTNAAAWLLLQVYQGCDGGLRPGPRKGAATSRGRRAESL